VYDRVDRAMSVHPSRQAQSVLSVGDTGGVPAQQRRPQLPQRLRLLAVEIVVLLVFLVVTARVADWLGITSVWGFRLIIAGVVLVPWMVLMLVRPELFGTKSASRRARQSEVD
jgi:amino acid permease